MYTPISKSYLLRYLFIFTLVLSASFNSFGQSGGVYTVAGGGTDTADGAPATSTRISSTNSLGLDMAGNLYYLEPDKNVIRKIDGGTGIVTTVAGRWGETTITGDGGPATAATLGSSLYKMHVTPLGHIYIADAQSIRKIDAATGIITTVAGGGTSVDDTGLATTADLSNVRSVYGTDNGDFYFCIRGKIIEVDSAMGRMRVIAGGGSTSCDSCPATTTQIEDQHTNIRMDNSGNMYIMEGHYFYEGRIHKINRTTGIMKRIYGGGGGDSIGGFGSNFVGSNSRFFDIDGSGQVFVSQNAMWTAIWRIDNSTGRIYPAAGGCILGSGVGCSNLDGTPARLYTGSPKTVLVNPALGIIYFTDEPPAWSGPSKIRKFSYTPLIPFSTTARNSFYTTVQKRCVGPKLTVRTNRYHAGMRVRTDFGDGTYDTSIINGTWSGTYGFALVNHNYTTHRTYNITQVLDSAGIPRDTITTTYNHVFCSDMSVSFYNDMDVDCIKDSTEPFLMQQVLTEIDSNGIPVDTIASTSGFNYTAYGNPSDIYRFKVISSPTGFFTSCPASGLIYDTLRTGISSNSLKMALACASGISNIDLEARAYVPVTGPNDQWGHLYLSNNYCPPSNGTVTLQFSPKYVYSGGAHPTPSSTTASSLTWNLSALTSLTSAPTDIYYQVWHNSAFPYPRDGDTVNERITITPTSGPPDVNMANNVVVRVDTVRTSCDPNAMEVVPGCFRNDTTFLCTIHFENIGSAPAENIYVMDTLSRYFDPTSIQIKMSTHPMFVTKYVAGGNTIMKFDFPNINLADSSDHLHRDGMLMYTIKNKPSLLGGLVLKSQAGIYFDYNDVLMTNVANVTVGCPWPLSTEEISNKNTPVTLHPNPATDELTITSPANKYERISITNMLGEHIMSLNLPKPTTTIDISTLPTGIYIVTLYGAKGSEVKKFVKE
jgi:hypothetical protein